MLTATPQDQSPVLAPTLSDFQLPAIPVPEDPTLSSRLHWNPTRMHTDTFKPAYLNTFLIYNSGSLCCSSHHPKALHGRDYLITTATVVSYLWGRIKAPCTPYSHHSNLYFSSTSLCWALRQEICSMWFLPWWHSHFRRILM